MDALFILLFAVSILYFAISVNIKRYIILLGFQGILLFLISLIGLHELSYFNIGFIAIETLVFKGFLIPMYLLNVAKKNKVTNVRNFKNHRKMKGFYLIIATIFIFIITIILGNLLKNDFIKVKYLATAITAVIMGLIFIVINKNITIHIISYIIIENGVFLLALAIGNEMPMLINTAILLDLLVSVLVLGVFFNKLTYQFKNDSSDALVNLKD
jgi:hydrogenase-4 component E